MSLKDSLAAQIPNRGGPICNLCEIVNGLDKDDKVALAAAMDDRRMTATMIVKALTDSGYDVGVASVRRHRRGECSAANVG